MLIAVFSRDVNRNIEECLNHEKERKIVFRYNQYLEQCSIRRSATGHATGLLLYPLKKSENEVFRF